MRERRGERGQGGAFFSLCNDPVPSPPSFSSSSLGRRPPQRPPSSRPVVRDGAIVIRPMMYLALSYDHRIVDGREAVTFLVRVKEAIEDPARLLIDL